MPEPRVSDAPLTWEAVLDAFGQYHAACAAIRAKGGKIIRDAGPMNAGTTIIAFVANPDGYYIELIGKR